MFGQSRLRIYTYVVDHPLLVVSRHVVDTRYSVVLQLQQIEVQTFRVCTKFQYHCHSGSRCTSLSTTEFTSRIQGQERVTTSRIASCSVVPQGCTWTQ